MADEPTESPTLDEIFAKNKANLDAIFDTIDPAPLETEKSEPKTRKRPHHRERDSSAVCFAFFASYTWRAELDSLAPYVSEIRGIPASRSETMRTALRLGMDQLRRQMKRSPSKRVEDDPLYVEPPTVAVPPVAPLAPPPATADAKPPSPAAPVVDDGMWKGPYPKGFLESLPPDFVRKPKFRVRRHIVEDFLREGHHPPKGA